MSIRARRDSLRKSSIGVDSIRKSVTSLSEGLVSIGRQSGELLKQTRKTNLFKSRLIRQDGEFFKRRRENVLRRQREDELEASSVSGVTKRQGNIIQKSTKGFLGRVLDFVGTLIIGWALLNLPKIISAFQKLFVNDMEKDQLPERVLNHSSTTAKNSVFQKLQNIPKKIELPNALPTESFVHNDVKPWTERDENVPPSVLRDKNLVS